MSKNTARRTIWALAATTLFLTAGCSQSTTGAAESNSVKPATTTAASPPAPVVNDCVANNPVVKPARMLLACGDGGLSVQNITWTSWGPDTAEGDGTQFRRVCVPNCASGSEKQAPTHITLRTLVGNYFTEAAITDPEGKPETWPVGPRR
ncbi:hypothetical protein [Nocardia jejuensis]|uniref:hypothetical protein n=1 Tax=Nocardia jejuensis TaxID=328049 RepID=UPI0008368799|nr:hypothetical protein [Nocardia jejuensis]